MSEFRTDEESIELVKNWWKENGTFLLVGVGVVLAGVFGYQAWQRYVAEQAQLASQRFAQLGEALQPGSRVPNETRALLVTQLKDEHGGTGYGVMAALLEARRLVERSEYDAASKELEWVIANTDRAELVDIARLRLARVKAAKGDADGALATLAAVTAKDYQSLVEELRGDLLLAKGDRAGAHAAYVKALAANTGTRAPILEVKRDDVAPVEG